MTTIVAVKKAGKLVMMADGQVTKGESFIAKGTANKLKIFKPKLHDSDVCIGIAGSVGDALILIDDLKTHLEASFNLKQGAEKFFKSWMADKYKRTLNASVILANHENIYEVGGDGVILEPDTEFASIGSGSPFALGFLNSGYDLLDDPKEIALKAMESASKYCVFTNSNYKEITSEKY